MKILKTGFGRGLLPAMAVAVVVAAVFVALPQATAQETAQQGADVGATGVPTPIPGKICKGNYLRIGVNDGSSHSGRRTFATRLSDRGVEDSLIQSLLGHGEPNMTMAYIEANMDKIKNAAKAIYPEL